jgi:hypothetical protein
LLNITWWTYPGSQLRSEFVENFEVGLPYELGRILHTLSSCLARKWSYKVYAVKSCHDERNPTDAG